MQMLLRLIGIIVIVEGILFLVKPKLLPQLVDFWKKGDRIYLGGIINILIGVLFLSNAYQSKLVGFIIAMGIISFAKGVAIFGCGKEKMKAMIDWWNRRSILVIRLTGLIAIALGLALIYSA